MTVIDAWGRNVSELGICHACGASIKYKYPFEGHVYGSTCIKKVSGIAPEEWVWENYKPSYEATLAKKAKKQAYYSNILFSEDESVKTIFTWRQFEVIAEIYAKDFGRRNSKAFKKEFDSFVAKWSIEE